MMDMGIVTSPLINAVKANNVNAVLSIVGGRAWIVCKRTPGTGRVALHYARSSAMVQALFSLCDPDLQLLVQDDDGETPLIRSISKSGDVECVRTLLDHIPEEQVMKQDFCGMSALSHALYIDRWDIARLCLRHEPFEQMIQEDISGSSVLEGAVSFKGDTSLLRFLLEYIPDDLTISTNLLVYLFMSIRNRNFESAHLIVSSQSNWDEADLSAVLSIALSTGSTNDPDSVRIVQLLLAKGAAREKIVSRGGEFFWRIIQDACQTILVPDFANEAIVRLAHCYRP